MHNLKELRKNLDTFKKKFENRNIDFDINDFKLIEYNPHPFISAPIAV